MKCCKYKPGDLNRKIEIQKQVTTETHTGGEKVDWEKVISPWAKITPMTGREKVHADRLDAVGMGTIVIRYRAGLDESMRVLYRGDVYNIRSIINIEEADEWLEITVERGVSQ